MLTLLSGSELEQVERTSSLTDFDKFGEAICAFANDLPGRGTPGHLFIGVDPRGVPTGANVNEAFLTALGGIRTEGRILPPPIMSVELLSIGTQSVAVIEVQPSDRPPVRFKGNVCVRVGPRRGRATPEEERRLSERTIDRTRTWDLRPCPEATLADLSTELFRLNYLPQAVSREVIAENQRSLEQQLAALRLYDLGRGLPTNGGVLLLGTNPLVFVPGAYVQYVRYSGQTQADPVVQELRISGDLLTVLRGLDELAARIAVRRPERQASMAETDVFDFPPLALRELFMNAMIHRNYEGSTTPVFVNEYSDRIEILNPGSLYGDLSASSFPGGTAYRNPLLAEAARVLGFVNRFGRGIALAQDALRRNSSPDLVLEPKENFFLAVVRRRP